MLNLRWTVDRTVRAQQNVVYTDLDDPVHHDDTLLHDERAVAAGHGAVHLSVVACNRLAPLAPPEPLVALLVVQVLKPPPLTQAFPSQQLPI